MAAFLFGFCLVLISALATPSPGILDNVLSNPLSRWQSAAVKGRLTCNGAPADNVKLKLYDVDMLPDVDDLMKEGYSNSDGTFELSGKEKEWTTIDPKLNIYHKCEHAGRCYRKVEVYLPKSFVSDGTEPNKTFDIGVLNLAARFVADTTDCFN